jgi:hypothetical protein
LVLGFLRSLSSVLISGQIFLCSCLGFRFDLVFGFGFGLANCQVLNAKCCLLLILVN